LLGVNNIEVTILFFFAAIATIEQAIFALINPQARWSTLKQAERLMNTEIWKFRCRMDNYSIKNLTAATVIKNMTKFTAELSTKVMSKAKLQESNMMSSNVGGISTR